MNTSCLRFRALLACFALLCLPVTAFAAAEFTNINVSTDGNSWSTSVSVAPGDTLYIRVQGTAGGSTNTWKGTQWGISDAGVAGDCANTPDHSANFSDVVFTVTVPALAANTYDLNLIPRQNDACTGSAGSLSVLENGITILGAAVCGNGIVESGEVCDDGNTNNGDCCSATCQFESNGSACGDTGVECLVDDTCDGSGTCVDNGFEAAATACGDASDTECTDPDTCDGAGTCEPNHALADSACGDTGVECLVDDTCDGSGTCVDNGFEAKGTACGDGTVTECTDADTCDGGGVCLFNNVECGSVTNSALCEFDEEPGKDGDQFRVAFSPDMQNWVSYKQNSTNPGQFYYNAIHDASAAVDGVSFELVIPYPFVTQGATPLHVYDADLVPSNGSGCLDPQEPLMAAQTVIGLADWLQGDGYVAPDYLVCDTTSLGETGDCVITVEVPQAVIDGTTNGWVYLNLHLDYGLKGPHVDADGDGNVDRYDRAGFISPWGSSDALFNTDDNTGDVAIADCSVHTFAHAVDTVPAFDDSVENLNVFKKAAGAFGHAECAADTSPLAGFIQLRRQDDHTAVYTTEIDEDGYYAAAFAHKGKPTYYYLAWCENAACLTPLDTTESFGLQSNGFVQVDLVDQGALCGGSDANLDVITPVYSSGKFK